MCKYYYLEKKTLPGVFMICPDRMNHGKSSTTTEPHFFEEVVRDYLELLDELKVDKFYTTGISMGGPYAMQMAAASDRCLGCAPVATFTDFLHPDLTKAEFGKATAGGLNMFINPATKPGCWGGGFGRWFLGKASGMASTNGLDPATVWNRMGARSPVGGKIEAARKAWEEDPFECSKLIDAGHNSGTHSRSYYLDMMRTCKKWPYDNKGIKCPTFIYTAENDGAFDACIGLGEANNKVIPNSEHLIYKGYGHASIGLAGTQIITALAQGKAAPQPYSM
jgi:pimeloyl-ACP methyl ester carboxylesterase